MTKAAAEEAAKDHVAQLKYLFEVIGLYPTDVPAEADPEEGNDLAKTLLARLRSRTSFQRKGKTRNSRLR